MVGVLVAERRADVAPVVAQRRRELLLGGDHQLGVLADQVEQRAEALDRQQLGDVRALAALAVLALAAARPRSSSPATAASSRCSSASSAAGAISTSCTSPERALRERREPAQRLDLDVEHVDAHGALLGRREDVEQPAAQRELAALLDLVDALVAGARRARAAHSSRSSSSPTRSVNECGRSAGSGTFSDSATALTTTTGRPVLAPAPSPLGAAAASRARPCAGPTRCGGGARCDS